MNAQPALKPTPQPRTIPERCFRCHTPLRACWLHVNHYAYCCGACADGHNCHCQPLHLAKQPA